MAATPQTQILPLQRKLQSGSFSALSQSALSRLTHLFFGSVLILACVGLCIAPLPWLGAGQFLLRLALALLFLIGGMVLLQTGIDNSVRELRFDARYRTLYVIQCHPKRRAQIVTRHSYDDIGNVEISDSEMMVIDRDGKLLVSLPLDGPQARADALMQIGTHLPFLT